MILVSSVDKILNPLFIFVRVKIDFKSPFKKLVDLKKIKNFKDFMLLRINSVPFNNIRKKTGVKDQLRQPISIRVIMPKDILVLPLDILVASHLPKPHDSELEETNKPFKQLILLKFRDVGGIFCINLLLIAMPKA